MPVLQALAARFAETRNLFRPCSLDRCRRHSSVALRAFGRHSVHYGAVEELADLVGRRPLHGLATVTADRLGSKHS